MAQLVDCIDERPVLLTGGAMLTVSCVVLLVAPQRVVWLAVSLRLAGVGRTARDIAELRDSLTDSPWAAPIESVHATLLLQTFNRDGVVTDHYGRA